MLTRPSDHDKQLLITGFEPFEGFPVNPSATVASRLDGHSYGRVLCVSRILPVEWARAWDILAEALTELRPDALVMLGAAQRTGIEIERFAHNRNAEKQDACGAYATDRYILNDGPERLETRLPIERLTGWGASSSEDAGGYLCNHIFYQALAHSDMRPEHCGFIHLPLGAESECAVLLARFAQSIGE